jgi:hypothetical protein
MEFDISRKGEFQGMPNQDHVLEVMFRNMGVNQGKLARKAEDSGYDYIENKIRHMWHGLIEAWIPYREARKDQKQKTALQKAGLKVSEYQHETTDIET